MYYGTRDNINYGFYLYKENLKSSVEVADADYKTLFDGQASGKAISHDDSGNPTLVEPESLLTTEQKTEIATKNIQAEINKRLSVINTTENQAKAFIDDDFKEEMKIALKKVLSVKEQSGYPLVVSWTGIPESL